MKLHFQRPEQVENHTATGALCFQSNKGHLSLPRTDNFARYPILKLYCESSLVKEKQPFFRDGHIFGWEWP